MNSPIWSIFLGKKLENTYPFLGVFFLNLVAALLEGGSFGFILLGLSSLSGEGGLSSQSFPWLSSILLEFGKSNGFIIFISFSFILQMMRTLLTYVGAYLAADLSLQIQSEAQTRVYSQIFTLSFPSINRYKIGDLVEYAKTPSLFIQVFIDHVNTSVVSILFAIVNLCAMMFISVKLTLVSLVLFGVFVASQKFLIRKIIKNSKSLASHMTELSKHTVPNLEGIRLIHTFFKHRSVMEKVEVLLEEISRVSKKMQLLNKSIPSLNELIGIFLIGIILIIGFSLLEGGPGSPLPLLLTFSALTYRLSSRLQVLLGSVGAIATYAGYLDRLNTILLPQEKEFIPTGGIAVSHLHSGIEFADVHFTYPGQHKPALSHLSFQIPKGSFTAFVGPSGGGKSSIIDLIVRLYQPTRGQILMNGTNIQEFNLEDWRKLFGVVSQESFLFNASVAENISFGKPEASIEKIREAAIMAGAHDFIQKLPHQYQTFVGEKGYRLSGGEKQRLALARALLKEPQILILDEATSNLDSLSEQLIQQALEQFRTHGTIICIAHRLSTIMDATQILVIQDGQVIEQGDHHSLVEDQRTYSHLWSLQS